MPICLRLYNTTLSECTFQPQLTKTPKYLKYNGLLTYQSENTSNKEENLTIPLMDQRTKIWMNKKADKLKLIKENEKDNINGTSAWNIFSSIFGRQKIQSVFSKWCSIYGTYCWERLIIFCD